MAKRAFDPLTYIPSAKVLREKLGEVQETARRLQVLLKTAEEIESGQVADIGAGPSEALTTDAPGGEGVPRG